MSGTLYTPVFRVSFPSVFKKNEKNNNPKYELTMLFSAETKKMTDELTKKFKGKPELTSVKQLQAEVDRLGKEKWGAKYDDPKFKSKLKLPFKDGEDKEYDGYGEGVIYAAARSATKPGVINMKCEHIVDEDEFYAGCYAIASINMFVTDKVIDGVPLKCVSIGLGNIQKVADGDPFSGRKRVEEEAFTAIDEPVDSCEDIDTDDL